jgi:hypothetical protein
MTNCILSLPEFPPLPKKKFSPTQRKFRELNGRYRRLSLAMRSLRYSECSSHNSFFWIFLTIPWKVSVKRLRNVRVGSDCSKCWFFSDLDGNTPPCGMLIFRQNGTASWHPRAQNCIFAVQLTKNECHTDETEAMRIGTDYSVLGLNTTNHSVCPSPLRVFRVASIPG